jgi:hypothetical protein
MPTSNSNQLRKGYTGFPQCNHCDIEADYGLNWDGECQKCSDHLPIALVINLLTSIFMNALCTYV